MWVTAGPHPLIPARFLFPAVTRARELFAAGRVLPPGAPLRRVIDLPADLDDLPGGERAAVAPLPPPGHGRRGRGLLRGPAPHALVAGPARPRRRPSWPATWAAGRRSSCATWPAASYLNIAHGLYPREPLPPRLLDALAAFLGRSVTPGQGRVYAGGLVKFEPREMERLPVPGPALLAAWPGPAQA